MRRTKFASSTAKWILLGAGIGIGLVGARRASGESTEDGVPPGMVAHVSGGLCPAGWVAASNVEGRIVVAVAEGKDVGVQVGAPLGDQEDRTHSHTYTGDVGLAPKSIAAVNGANQEGAKAQSYTIAGTTNAGPSGLPFVQVMTCVKQ